MFIGSEKLGAPNEERAVALLPSANREAQERAAETNSLIKEIDVAERKRAAKSSCCFFACLHLRSFLSAASFLQPHVTSLGHKWQRQTSSSTKKKEQNSKVDFSSE
jgi:hypothetical protein